MCGVPALEIWGRKNTGTRDAHRFLRIRTWGYVLRLSHFRFELGATALNISGYESPYDPENSGGGCKHEKINGFVGADVVDFLGHRVACEFRARFGSDTARPRSAEFRRLPESGSGPQRTPHGRSSASQARQIQLAHARGSRHLGR